ncbi:UNVERIFIED_CONTAM: hypothetical protein GTU68_029498 [Idotea baltica]|nr:hypothetical protein [Idotea baltica]
MMDCKKALDLTGGDFNAAEDHLRKMGLKAAGKKVGRATGEGRCFSTLSDCGTKGALVALACETDFVAATADFQQYLEDLGMHAAALPPTALSRDQIDPELVEREKAIYREEVKGKPEDIQEKIIGGKLNKFYGGICLREQPWVMDDSKSVEKAIEDLLGKGSIITDYARFNVGE